MYKHLIQSPGEVSLHQGIARPNHEKAIVTSEAIALSSSILTVLNIHAPCDMFSSMSVELAFRSAFLPPSRLECWKAFPNESRQSSGKGVVYYTNIAVRPPPVSPSMAANTRSQRARPEPENGDESALGIPLLSRSPTHSMVKPPPPPPRNLQAAMTVLFAGWARRHMLTKENRFNPRRHRQNTANTANTSTSANGQDPQLKGLISSVLLFPLLLYVALGPLRT
jgi:hypothetical protein